MTSSASSSEPVGDLSSAAIPQGREEIARLIVKAFADAGFGRPQQLAALANAIAESDLNPKAMSAPPEEGVGLFQLNRAGGLGRGHSVAELETPLPTSTLFCRKRENSTISPRRRLWTMPSAFSFESWSVLPTLQVKSSAA